MSASKGLYQGCPQIIWDDTYTAVLDSIIKLLITKRTAYTSHPKKVSRAKYTQNTELATMDLRAVTS